MDLGTAHILYPHQKATPDRVEIEDGKVPLKPGGYDIAAYT